MAHWYGQAYQQETGTTIQHVDNIVLTRNDEMPYERGQTLAAQWVASNDIPSTRTYNVGAFWASSVVGIFFLSAFSFLFLI